MMKKYSAQQRVYESKTLMSWLRTPESAFLRHLSWGNKLQQRSLVFVFVNELLPYDLMWCAINDLP